MLEITLVGGFLDSGKTTYIKSEMDDDDLVFLLEDGEEKIDNGIYIDKITEVSLKDSKKHAFVELNGTSSIENFLENIENGTYKLKLKESVFIINPDNFFNLRNYFPEIYEKELYYYDKIIIRESKNQKEVYKFLKNRDFKSQIILLDGENEKDVTAVKDSIFIIFSLLFVLFSGLYLTLGESVFKNKLSNFVLNFTSIFLEVIPFFLLGSLISSIIRHINSKNLLVKSSDNIFISFIKAVLLAFIFPVCDCAGIPVGLGFYKQNRDQYFSILFILLSPSINPIVMISTYIAFGGIKYVFLRIVASIFSAIMVTVLWKVFKFKLKEPKNYDTNCNCEICLDDSNKSLREKFVSVLLLCGEDFMKNIFILVFGIAISSLAKTFVPQFLLTGYLGVLISIILAYLFSLCSSSDAFVAKTLFNNFGNSLTFLVMGPSMDFKNSMIFMRSQGYKNTFKLIALHALSVLIIVSIFISLGGLNV